VGMPTTFTGRLGVFIPERAESGGSFRSRGRVDGGRPVSIRSLLAGLAFTLTLALGRGLLLIVAG